MVDDELVGQIATARRQIAPSLPKHADARSVERAAFSAVGRNELGLRVWAEAREAGEAAKRIKRTALQKRYGARNPHGWLPLVALTGALCAAVAAALTSGLRTDPAEMTVATNVLAVIAAATSLVVSIVAGGKPLNRSMIRIHGVLTVALVITAAFVLSRGTDAGAWIVAGSAVISLIGIGLILLARARDRAGTEEMDTALNVAVADIGPELRAASERLQAQVAQELGAQDAARIVEIRTALLRDLAREGISLAPVDASTPAGSVIIDDLIRSWLPEAQRREV
ncbi:MAG: hypothetical protein WBX17_02415 [Microbacterium sp.]